MSKYERVVAELVATPKVWLITGVAGFIGSNLLERLLKMGQTVVGLDNFSTGYQYNLDEVESLVSKEQWERFYFIEGDICDFDVCKCAVENVDYVLHQAALGSVPRSIVDPLTTNQSNINGFLNMLTAAKDADVDSFTYAASSSTYGDHAALPKVEDTIGVPLSPYAVTKYVNELYASVFAKTYGFKTIGLRYFNVFGARQDPNGAYAAVIPKWVAAMITGMPVYINGDGETSRDFCFIENVIQMNILAATASEESKDEVYNVAVGGRSSLNDLASLLKEVLSAKDVNVVSEILYRDFRCGDVRHSQADITKAKTLLQYAPEYSLEDGLVISALWYLDKLK